VAHWRVSGSGSVDATQMKQSCVGLRAHVYGALRAVAEPGDMWVARRSFT
jgi:hypothetical protein